MSRKRSRMKSLQIDDPEPSTPPSIPEPAPIDPGHVELLRRLTRHSDEIVEQTSMVNVGHSPVKRSSRHTTGDAGSSKSIPDDPFLDDSSFGSSAPRLPTGIESGFNPVKLSEETCLPKPTPHEAVESVEEDCIWELAARGYATAARDVAMFLVEYSSSFRFLLCKSYEHEDGAKAAAEEKTEGAKKQKTQSTWEDPLHAFLEVLDSCVDEILRHDGPPDPAVNGEELRCSNPSCSKTLLHEHFRCRDCPSVGNWWCRECVVKNHTAGYLHRIEEWGGTHYTRVPLKSLGLCIQLGHPPGKKCSAKRQAVGDDFVIIDSDGIHEVGLDFCRCEKEKPVHIQLLEARLLPAFVVGPRTAATFRVLETYQMLSFTAKVSAFEFLMAISRRSSNIVETPVRYREFLRIIHMWRHLRMLKRGGRGHDDTGAAGTREGELALPCPACPQVGINLPSNWNDVKERWKHALFLAIDANFRLRRKNVSTDGRDPGLNHGYAYIVSEVPFKRWLGRYGDPLKEIPETQTCNNHDAVKSASLRGGKGLAASGLGTCCCSRHDMQRPCSSGDLQKGKKYCNMDFYFLSTLLFMIPFALVISYDIACQWSRNLLNRCNNVYKEDGDTNVLSKDPNVKARFAVPKFHLPAHVEKCHANYNLNYMPFVGRTDGEAPERGWANSNDLAYSTREMGAGSRRDTLDDAFGDRNWAKTTKIDKMLAECAREAIDMRVAQIFAFLVFASGLWDDNVQDWTAMVKAWEEDPSNDNPFETTGEEITEKDVYENLQNEVDADIKKGDVPKLQSSLMPCEFLRQGIELEESQRKHAIDVAKLGSHSRDIDRSKVTEAGNVIKERFDSWEISQRMFMPSVIAYRERGEGDVGSAPGASQLVKDLRLLMPSAIIGKNVVFGKHLAKYEFRLRIAQAHACVREIRGLILWRSQRLIIKKKDGSGTEMMTKSNTLIHNITTNLGHQKQKYDGIRVCLVALGHYLGESDWEKVLKPMATSDLASLTFFDDEKKGDRYKELSWIWLVNGSDTGNSAVDNTVRIEFCRARARAHRWQEECILLYEEMKRVERFFEWDSRKWTDRAEAYQKKFNDPITITPDIANFPELIARKTRRRDRVLAGKVAFAHRQAAIRKSLLKKAKSNFAPLYTPMQKMERMEVCGRVVDGLKFVEGQGKLRKKN